MRKYRAAWRDGLLCCLFAPAYGEFTPSLPSPWPRFGWQTGGIPSDPDHRRADVGSFCSFGCTKQRQRAARTPSPESLRSRFDAAANPFAPVGRWLCLFGVFAGFWLLSIVSFLRFQNGEHFIVVESGSLTYEHNNGLASSDSGDAEPPVRWLADWAHSRELIFLPHVQSEIIPEDGERWRLVFPLWIPLAITATIVRARRRAARRIPPGHCRVCGYNLTGNLSGKCPECGTPCVGASPPTLSKPAKG